jgi:hypothetical protein
MPAQTLPGAQRAAAFSPQDELLSLIRYHKAWKRFSSYASFSMTALSIVSAATASVTAGLQFATVASILAGLATVFTTLEKVLQFRERWDLHRITADDLAQVEWNMQVKGLSSAEAADQVFNIVKRYNDKMSTFRAHTGG